MKKRHRLSSPSDAAIVSKKMKVTDENDLVADIHTEQEQIPTYLLPTNPFFEHMIHKVINITNSSITMNDLRQLAIVKHHIASLHITKEISMIYLQAGIGTLREPHYLELVPVDRRVWPKQVKSTLFERRSTTAAATTTMEINTEGEHLECQNLVYERFQEINKKIEHYERQYEEKKSQFIDFTSHMEESIQCFVQQYGIKPLEMKRDLKIALLKHDYDAELLERQYLQEKPNGYQVNRIVSIYI